MKGRYRVYLDGALVQESDNVITNRGRIAIGRFLAGERFTWSDAIAMGAGETEALATDTELEMEAWREEIDMRQYDIPTGEILVRSIVPASVSGTFYEMGVYCTLSSLRQISSSPVAIYFDSSKELWSFSNAAFNTDHNRIGKSAVTFSPTAGSNSTAQSRLVGNFSNYDENSFFYLSYKLLSGSIDSISIRLSSSETTYREYVIPVSSSEGEYFVDRWQTSDFELFGNADWTEFNEISVVVAGDGAISLDGFSVRNEPAGIETVLVSRTILDSPVTKDESQEMQIEYVIDFGVNI